MIFPGFFEVKPGGARLPPGSVPSQRGHVGRKSRDWTRVVRLPINSALLWFALNTAGR